MWKITCTEPVVIKLVVNSENKWKYLEVSTHFGFMDCMDSLLNHHPWSPRGNKVTVVMNKNNVAFVLFCKHSFTVQCETKLRWILVDSVLSRQRFEWWRWLPKGEIVNRSSATKGFPWLCVTTHLQPVNCCKQGKHRRLLNAMNPDSYVLCDKTDSSETNPAFLMKRTRVKEQLSFKLNNPLQRRNR